MNNQGQSFSKGETLFKTILLDILFWYHYPADEWLLSKYWTFISDSKKINDFLIGIRAAESVYISKKQVVVILVCLSQIIVDRTGEETQNSDLSYSLSFSDVSTLWTTLSEIS